VNANFTATTTGEGGDGGWDVVATANRNNPVEDVVGELRDSGAPVAGDIANSGRTTTFTGSQQVLEGDEWVTYPIIAGDAAFFNAENATLAARAAGYDSDRSALDAVGHDSSLAIVDATDWGPYGFTWSVEHKDGFEPFNVSFRDAVTLEERTVTVVGVLGTRLNAEVIAGLYVNDDAYTPVFGAPAYQRTYIQRADGANVRDSARSIESALAAEGVQADGIKQLIDKSAAQDRAFTRMFQGFMALGLIVGINALGVIAFRSVV
jgi:putative ABC transport system permease protein